MRKFFQLLFLLMSLKTFGVSPGFWDSPITAEKIAKGSAVILNMQIENDNTYWCELRPSNKGKHTIVRLDSKGNKEDMTPPDFDVRTFVHEYGGKAFLVVDDIIYASNGDDGDIYIFESKKEPRKLTQGGTRFTEMKYSPFGIIAIGELHGEDQVENFLALINTKDGSYKRLASSYDFYSSPDISPDYKKITWLCWNHPEMPWTHNALWIAEFDAAGELINKKQIAGFIPESIFQPTWSPDGTLYFVTDREKGWWNLHCYELGKIKNICPMSAEMAEPLWSLDLSTFAFLGNKIAFTYNQNGIWHLAIKDPHTSNLQKIKTEGTYLHQFQRGKNYVQFLEDYPTKRSAVVRLEADGSLKVLDQKEVQFDQGYLSEGSHISFPSKDRTAYGYYYSPKNKNYLLSDEKPPLIVEIHGGPTAQATLGLHLGHQFWTSRGYAVLDVNYGGSTGYGRDYRNLLDGNWGVVDVEDCVNGALYLVNKGLVDGNKLIIRGGSSGGYTTLAALAFTKTFKAGASYFGISDITALADAPHKFESRYSDRLVGKYPEKKDLWESRSPIHSVDKITAPLILFQGEIDKIVPKNQATLIYDALKKRNIPVELHIYPGEGHGFRKSENIIHSLNREAKFYEEVFAKTDK